MIKDLMGDFHERKILTVLGIAGLGFSVLQGGTNPVNAMMISGITVIGVIIADMYYCTNRNGKYQVTDHIRKLMFFGGLGVLSFLIIILPEIMFLIAGILVASVAYRIYKEQALTEDQIMNQSTTFMTAILFFIIYLVPEIFIVPIIFLFTKFLVEEWPDKVAI